MTLYSELENTSDSQLYQRTPFFLPQTCGLRWVYNIPRTGIYFPNTTQDETVADLEREKVSGTDGTSSEQLYTANCGITGNPILVGGLEHVFLFSIYWELHHPNCQTFFRGVETVETTNQHSWTNGPWNFGPIVVLVPWKSPRLWGNRLKPDPNDGCLLLQPINICWYTCVILNMYMYWYEPSPAHTLVDWYKHQWLVGCQIATFVLTGCYTLW